MKFIYSNSMVLVASLALLFPSASAWSQVDYNNPSEITIPDEKDMLLALSQNPTLRERLPVQFSFLTWNIHKAADGAVWAADFEKTAEGIDLILIQESMSFPLVREAFQGISFAEFWMAQSFMFTDGVSTGVSTGSTTKLVSVEAFRSPESEPFLKSPKTSLVSVFEMEDGVPLMVINLHGLNFSGARRLESQLEHLRPTVEKFQGRKVFAGDFNTWSPARTNALKKYMDSLGFSEVLFEEDPRRQILDRIFLVGCHAVKADILTQVTSSDHLPIKAEIACP